MVAIPFIAPYLPVESLSFRFSHSYIFKINRLYDILENELNQNKLISGLTGELNIAVTYEFIKEHARVCQFNPLHVLFYQSSRKSKNVQISIFFCFIQFSVNFLFIVPMLHLQLHFRLSFSGGLGNTPTSGICGIVFIQCTPITCLLLSGHSFLVKSTHPEPGRK